MSDQPGLLSSVDKRQHPPRALISTWNKEGLTALGLGLQAQGWVIVSTGGTARTLREGGVEVTDVSDVTGHPEVMDGRVKTLHPAVHAPLLARLEGEDDPKVLTELGYTPIELVVVNLYPFTSAAAKKPPLPDSELLEMIDIGGPTMVRAAAKNHRNVLILTDPKQYGPFLEELESVGGSPSQIGLESRRKFALEAFEHTATYDIGIANELHSRWKSDEPLPDQFLVSAKKKDVLRYGENPHQSAAFYATEGDQPQLLAAAIKHSGKEISYNNLLDLEATFRLVRSLSTDEWPKTPHACVIMKHSNPCGAALGPNQVEAWNKALASDLESAFGGIIAFNETVTKEVAEAIGGHFVECLIAPAYEEEALAILSEKKNRRLLSLPSAADENGRFLPLPESVETRPVAGGWLVQTDGPPNIDWDSAQQVTNTGFSPDDLKAARFGVRVCQQVKSNAILLIDGLATVGVGPGQTSRVQAAKIAISRAGERSRGSMLISDAFFPFRDGIDVAAEAGVTHIVQPGGSMRDSEVVEAANEHEMAMVMMGMRLFKH